MGQGVSEAAGRALLARRAVTVEGRNRRGLAGSRSVVWRQCRVPGALRDVVVLRTARCSAARPPAACSCILSSSSRCQTSVIRRGPTVLFGSS